MFFERTSDHSLDLKPGDVNSIMLESWLSARRQEQLLKASGVNNNIRLLHGWFNIAVESVVLVESPAKYRKNCFAKKIPGG